MVEFFEEDTFPHKLGTCTGYVSTGNDGGQVQV